MQDSQAISNDIDTAGKIQYSQSLISIYPLQDMVKIIVSQFSSKVFIKIREIQCIQLVIGPVALVVG
jgi:hypothetical protein